MKPRLLDLFCGAGGTGTGFARVGFEVVGVDKEPQPNYPFEFIQGDALDPPVSFDEFDVIVAGPPCQFASDLRHRTRKEYPDLVTPTREMLQAVGLPYVIENVAPHVLIEPLMLCGSMFGLGANGRQLRRHRYFECSFFVMTPEPCRHKGQPVGVYGTGGGGQMTRGYKGTPEEYREAMGIDWATRAEIAQAIPPAYTEHIGPYLMAAVNATCPT